MSYEACMRISVSILTPKAFSIRKAISPESAALLFKRLERAGLETPKAAAAAVTERPAGTMISVRMKIAGMRRILHRHSLRSPPLVIVFQIQVADVAIDAVDSECEAAISSDAEAPHIFAIGAEQMNAPIRQRAKLLRLFHLLQKQ